MRVAVEVTQMGAERLDLHAGLCDRALTRHSLRYAGQVERDYDAFRVAVRSGRLASDPVPSALEQ